MARVGSIAFGTVDPLPSPNALERLAQVLEELRAEPPSPERTTAVFWAAQLLACHHAAWPEAAQTVAQLSAWADEALTRAHASHASTYARYYAALFSQQHFGQGQMDEAEHFATLGLERAPRPAQGAELDATEVARNVDLRQLSARIALERGRISAAREHIRAMQEEIGALEASDEAARAARDALAAKAEGEWAQFWLNLGVLDRADLHIERGLGIMRALGAVQPSLLLQRADLLLLKDESERLEREIEGWLAEGGPEMDPRLRTLLTLQQALAASESEREDPEREAVAETRLRALLNGDSGANGERSALSPKERAKAHLELADLALRADSLEEVETQLAAARRLLTGPGATAMSDLRSLIAVYEALLALRGSPSAADLKQHERSLQGHFEALLDSWNSSGRVPGGIGFLHSAARRQVISTLVSVLLAQGAGEADAPSARARAIGPLLRAQAMGSLAQSLNAPTHLTLAELRDEFLAEEHGVLLYLPDKLDGASHLFAFDRERLVHVGLPMRDRLRVDLRKLEESLATHPGTLSASDRAFHAKRLRHQANKVAEVLLPEDVRPLLATWKTVTVVGAELLGTVPFELLPLPREGVASAERELFGNALAVHSLASLPLGVALHRREAFVPRYELGVVAELELGDALRGSDFAEAEHLVDIRLQEDDHEALTAAFPTDRTWGLFGEQATEAQLLAQVPKMRETSVLHFLLHGLYLPDLERGSVLVLRGNEELGSHFLTCDEVESRLELNGLVLLSSCGTGLGPDRLGDDNLANLGGAFLRAGARAVVLSRAPLEYERTRAPDGSPHPRVEKGALAGRSPTPGEASDGG